MKNKLLITIITTITLVFCVVIAFDFFPHLRGPSYYPPEWRWHYLFINTLYKLYLPVLFLLLSIGLFLWIERRKKITPKQRWFVLLALIVVFVGFQFSLLYFSRSGVGVLVHRIINPEINGYFTAALSITSVPDFLRVYNSIMLDFVYHAKAHPPGAILLFYYIEQLVKLIPALNDFAAHMSPSHVDVKAIWNPLTASQKATALVSSVVIPVLSALSIIPLYFTAKMLFGEKTALRSIFLFLFIPSLVFFIPINDAFLHVFSITAFCFFVYGLQKNKLWPLLLSGSVLFVGIFFNLSLLPLLVLFFIYFILYEFKNIKSDIASVFRKGILFVIGLLVPFFLLFVFFQFNFIQVTMTIMANVPDVHTRSYTLWIFYNLYDFFVFTGLPLAVVYFAYFKDVLRNRLKNALPLFIAFTLMILILNFSGSVRGETGRLWSPYIPFIVLIVTWVLTVKYKFSTKLFAVVLLLQALQILIMQEFWVMLW